MWHEIFSIVRDVLVGAALCYVKFMLDRMERAQEAHEREVAAKLGTGDVHAGAAAAGQANGLDKQSSPPNRPRPRVRRT